MPEHSGSSNTDTTAIYRFVVEGRLNLYWENWFGADFTVREAEERTTLTGSVVDQSSLYSLIRKIRDLGVPLISVTRMDEEADKA